MELLIINYIILSLIIDHGRSRVRIILKFDLCKKKKYNEPAMIYDTFHKLLIK